MLCKGVVVVLVIFQSSTNAMKKSQQIFGDRQSPPTENTRRLYDPTSFDMLDDMVIPNEVKTQLFDPNADQRRNAIINEELLWPDKVVRYFIDSEFNETHRAEIKKGVSMIESQSCIKFVELNAPPKELDIDEPYVHINSISGCFAQVGSMCDKCQMSLDIPGGCVRQGTIAHEFLHSLGFYHMQCTAGRDGYIEVMWDNLNSNAFGNFKEYATKTTLVGTEYDYESIMHYGSYFFSKNRDFTIKTKNKKAQKSIGQRTHLSTGDITRLNRLYNCDGY